MNWTGGGLSRSRNAKGSLTAKQKSYFAKARGRLQDRRPSPNKLQSFEFGEWLPERNDDGFPPFHTRQEEPPSVQKTLDQFATIRPIVKRLEGLKERREPRKRKRTPLTEPRENKVQPKLPKLQPDKPIVIGSSPSASSSSPRDSPMVIHRPPQSSSSEDILNAHSIEEKRRRILEMDDWVGVDRPAANPVKMKFADPADKDLIGKRRRITKVNYRHPSDRRRAVGRAAILLRNDHHISKTADGYYPEGDVSVRIGSAVDRSDGRASLRNQDRLSVMSDELLDGEPSLAANGPLTSVPVYNTPGSTPVRWSSHSCREVPTPSVYMDSSSSSNAGSSKRTKHHRPNPLPAKAAAGFTSNGIDELREWALPAGEPGRGHEEPKFRLFFDNMLRPQASYLDERGKSPIVRDFGIRQASTPKALSQRAAAESTLDTTKHKIRVQESEDIKQSKPDKRQSHAMSRAHIQANVAAQSIPTATGKSAPDNLENDNHTHSDPKIADLTFATPPSAEKASAQLLTEFHGRVASNAKLDDSLTGTLADLEKRWAMTTGKGLPKTAGVAAPRDVQRAGVISHEQTNNAGQRKHSRGYLTGPISAEPTASLPQARPQAPKVPHASEVQQHPAKQSCSPILDHGQSQPTITAKEAELKTAQDEEAVWRKIVFGDEQEEILDYTFGGHEPLNFAVPSPTQPSLLAEAATSPLKQNPHLADSTFNASSSSPDAFRSPLRTCTDNPSDITTANTNQSSTPQISSPHSSTLSPAPSSPQIPLPRTLRNPSNSSLLAEASTTSQIHPSLATLSSDELARSPERLIFNSKAQAQNINGEYQKQGASTTQPHDQSSLPQQSKIVFKKPTRYVGSHALDPPERIMLGDRVLRSGRRVGKKRAMGGEGKKRGMGRRREGDAYRRREGGKGDSEDDEDDLKEEEEDDIVDD